MLRAHETSFVRTLAEPFLLDGFAITDCLSIKDCKTLECSMFLQDWHRFLDVGAPSSH